MDASDNSSNSEKLEKPCALQLEDDRLLSVIGATCVIVPAVACFAGWLHASAFFSQLGAPWITEMLSPIDFLKSGAPTLTAMLLGAVVACGWHLGGRLPRKGVGWVTTGLLGLGCLSLLASALFTWSPKQDAALASVQAFLFATAAGVALFEFALTPKTHTFRLDCFSAAYVILLYGLLQSPQTAGRADALHAVAGACNNLPTVALQTPDPDHKWHLLRVVSDQAILMGIGPDCTPSGFRAIALESLGLVAPVRRKSEAQE